MKDRDAGSPKEAARAERERRLAEALRANLRRRKSAGAGPSRRNETDAAGRLPRKAPHPGTGER